MLECVDARLFIETSVSSTFTQDSHSICAHRLGTIIDFDQICVLENAKMVEYMYGTHSRCSVILLSGFISDRCGWLSRVYFTTGAPGDLLQEGHIQRSVLEADRPHRPGGLVTPALGGDGQEDASESAALDEGGGRLELVRLLVEWYCSSFHI